MEGDGMDLQHSGDSGGGVMASWRVEGNDR